MENILRFCIKLFALSCSLLIPAGILHAQEIEPNNTFAQATPLPVNIYLPGNTDYPGDVDWYKVIMPGDGDVTVMIFNAGNLAVKTLSWYQKDGLTLIQKGSQGGYADGNGGWGWGVGGIFADTFYLKVEAGQTGPYEVYFELLPVPGPSDVEPNNDISHALSLPLNDSAKGHIAFAYNPSSLAFDAIDCYKITTNSAGPLHIYAENVGCGGGTDLLLYASDGSTLLNSVGFYCDHPGVLEQDSLAAGTYYIMVTGVLGGFGSYTLAADLVTQVKNTDLEPNNIISQSSVFQLNHSITGSIGSYYNGQKDTSDWYKIKMPDSGSLRISLNNSSNKNLTLLFYDNDGNHVVGSSTVGKGIANIETITLPPGTYYAEVSGAAGNTSDTSAYTITNSFTPRPATFKRTDPKVALDKIILKSPAAGLNNKVSPLQKITRTR